MAAPLTRKDSCQGRTLCCLESGYGGGDGGPERKWRDKSGVCSVLVTGEGMSLFQKVMNYLVGEVMVKSLGNSYSSHTYCFFAEVLF